MTPENTEIVTGRANETRYFAKPEFMWEGFGQATEAEKNWKFDVEGALELLPQLVEQEDILWINLLHKLNIYVHVYIYTYIKCELLSKLQGTKWKSMMPFMYWLKTI